MESTVPTKPIDSAVTPAMFHVLTALADQDLHGYAIMQEIEARTAGAAVVGPGTLYRTLKHLHSSGLVTETTSAADAKRTYRITAAGRQVASLEAHRLAELVKWAVDVRLLRGGP